MTKLRKFFASSVMIMTVVVMSGFVAPTTKAAASAGDLIKKDGLSAVYYLGDDGKRYVFPNEATYKSWYSDFSGVVTISSDELSSYPLGGNVVVRPGTFLVKITTDPKVYAVEANGTLRWVQTEADAIALYGTNWAKRVIDVADSFFINYTIGSPLASNEVPFGVLVQKTGESNIYYYDGSEYRLVEDEVAFLANRFQFSNVLTYNNFTPSGSALTGAEANIIKTSQNGATGPIVTGSGVTVSLNSMTPVSSSVMATQALVPFTTINLTAANDGSITVKSIKLKRTGISSDSAVSNVYLYEGNTRLTDASSLSNGYVNFSTSNLITIPAGQTKTLTVKVDMASSNSGGNLGFAVESASDIVSTGASVSGSFPISGNLMSLLSAQSDLAAVTLSAGTMASSPIKAGNSNMIVWSANTSVTKKAVDFKYLALKQVGSINNDDLANLSLYVDGTKVSTGVLTSNNDLVFDLTSAPSRLNIGSHTVELKADIVKGSSRTFNFQLQTVANTVFTDTNYGVNIAPAGTIVSGTSYLISSGTVTTASDSSFTATEVVKTASNVSLGKFTMKAWGEDVKINTLAASLSFTGTSSATVTEGLNDLAIFVDGNQVGSSQTVNLATSSENATTSKSFGTTNLFTIPAGETVVVEIKASLNLDTATTSLITAIKASLGAGAGQGVTSYSAVTTAAVDGKTLSVVTGSLSVAKNGSMQDMNVSKNTKVRLGSYILSAGSAEGVTVSNIRVGVNATSSTVLDNMTNLYISENTTPIQPQAANDFNVNLLIDKNQTKTIDVWANLGDIASDLQASTTLIVTYRTNVTLTNGTTNSATGQTITLKSASLNHNPTVVANTPAAGFVLGGTTGTIGNYKFVATNGNVHITEMSFTASTTFAGIGQVIVDGVTTPVVNGLVTVTGLNKEIVAGNQGTNVEVKAVYNNVTSDGQGGVTTGNDVNLTLTGFKYNVAGVQTVVTDRTIATPSMRLVSSYPTVVDTSNYSSKLLTAGAKSEVMRFSITATGGNSVNVKTIGLMANYDYNCGASSTKKVYIEDASALGTNLANSGAVYGATTGTSSVITLDSAVEIPAGQTKTFVVYVDNSGTTTTGNYFRMDMVNAGWTWNDGTIDTYTIGGTHIKEFVGTTFQK